MTGTTLDRPTPTSVSTSVEPRTGAHAVARTLADTAADAAPAVRTPVPPLPTRPRPPSRPGATASASRSSSPW